MMWLEEMASIFLTPYLLIFVVPKRVDDILQFIAEFTVNIEGVGDVCSFSAFDFQRHGNRNYASPYSSLRTQRSSQGKMEKSFLSFQTSYPSWRPNAQGIQFLTTLRNFRDQKLRGLVSGHVYSPPRMWQRSPHLREQNTRNNPFGREASQNSPVPGCHLGSLWLIETDPKAHPYLLDWFYVSGPHEMPDNNASDVPPVALDIDKEQNKEDSWMPPLQNRSLSHLEASTSSPFFQEQSVLRHFDSSSTMPPTGKSQWWARGGPGSAEPQQASFLEPPEFSPHTDPPQTSFLEPPEYKHQNVVDYYESHSERSIDEEEQPFDWRNYHNLSRTTYPDEFGGSGEFKLHFDDIFRTPDSA